MAFDPCPHQITQIVIKAAMLRRKELGLPEEKNITILYNEMAPLLGVAPIRKSSSEVNHLPRPDEMKNEKGQTLLPSKKCPKCGQNTVFPASVCRSCKDWQDGYRSSWSCITKECGYKELLTIPYTKLLDEVAPGWESGFKKAMGIKTLTDQGLK